jgi:hypothetical protein
VQELEQVNMGQALLLILQLITVGYMYLKDMVVPEIADKSVSLQLKYPVDDIWLVKSCQAVAVLLQNLLPFSLVGVSSNGDKERKLAAVSYNSH